MSFLLEWLIFYIAIMFTMSVDNIFWIPTSPEYKKYKKLPFFKKAFLGYFIIVESKFYHTKLQYIIKYRIWSVITHWRDIIPAVITSLILAVIL